jgi:hypothetical protein
MFMLHILLVRLSVHVWYNVLPAKIKRDSNVFMFYNACLLVMHPVSEIFVNIFMYSLRFQTGFLKANRKKMCP